MRFGYAIVYVPDVPATLAFWERAFGLQRRAPAEGGEYGELATGATVLAFAAETLAAGHGFPIRANRAEADPAGFEIALITADVPRAFDRAVAAGAAPASAPTRKPWGQTVGYVRDPNGVLVELCTPLGA
jgi:catechol 2,3-dioxygenase-like lactoylglutathione lyase family enzyme